MATPTPTATAPVILIHVSNPDPGLARDWAIIDHTLFPVPAPELGCVPTPVDVTMSMGVFRLFYGAYINRNRLNLDLSPAKLV